MIGAIQVVTSYLGEYGHVLQERCELFTVRGLFIVARGPGLSRNEAYESAFQLVDRYVISFNKFI